MASPFCLRCLRRSLEIPNGYSPTARLFSTTPSLHANPSPKKKTITAKPASRAGRTLRLTKNTRSQAGKPPAPGERKAVRKRVVLSNTNALEVKGLEDLSGDKVGSLESWEGKVLGLENATVDALRALESFRSGQGWGLFRRPAVLVRRETAALAKDLLRAETEKQSIRKIICGPASSGKSVLLLQAQAMAHLRGWLVLHFPEAQDIVSAQTSFQPIRTPSGETEYIQPHYTAMILRNFATANQNVLSTLRLSKTHDNLPIPIQPNISLSRFAEHGARDPELAWPIFQALFAELTTPSATESGLQRPPVLLSMDGVDKIMRPSAYLDASAQPIHAHSLALVQHFTSYLSGSTPFPNGGAVLGATCASNRASAPTFSHILKEAHESRTPFSPRDARVDAVMKGVVPRPGLVGNFGSIGVVKLAGLSKGETRAIMEYYANSGLLRGAVTEGMVGEKWSLAGSGIVGALEKAVVGIRF